MNIEDVSIANQHGTVAGVTEDGRLMAESVSCDMDLAVALQSGLAFTLHDDAVTPTGAGDYFAKLANTSDFPMVVHRLRFRDAGAEVLAVDVGPDYVGATSHAELEPVNRCVGSVELASDYGTFESDVDITGQVTTYEVQRIKVAANTDYDLDLSTAPIVLLKNQAMSLRAVTGTAAIVYSVDFYFQAISSKDEV